MALAAVAIRGAERATEKYWSASQLKSLGKDIASANASGSGINVLLQEKNFRSVLLHRQDTSQVEVHESLAEFYIVQNGSGTIVVGGKAGDLRRTDPGELRGDRLDGGVSHEMHAADMLYVPANTPHRVVVTPGQSFDAIVVKIAADR